LEIAKERRFHTFPPHDDHDVLKGHFNFAQLVTFQLCSNKIVLAPDRNVGEDVVKSENIPPLL
jgi:hypothetical protein